ncbi:MAG: helix-turn-helix domain-containing protein [Planctomycetes bacterium]|nr:helix-turn-helix domain-containing protein [Planctomycetota bacterium]
MSQTNRILTMREVADRLRCSVSTVKQHIARGRLAAINLGTANQKHYRVTESALADFLDSAPEPAAAFPRRIDPPIATTRFMRRLSS